MKIQVLENFGGVETNERRILPGVYDMTDSALFGAGQVLLDLGKAVVIEYDAPAEPEPAETEAETTDIEETPRQPPKPKRR